jgi:hypothetical protein
MKSSDSGIMLTMLLKYSSTTDIGAMMKILIYSNIDLYRDSSYEGRAEADLVAYNVNEQGRNSRWDRSYKIIKDSKRLLFGVDRLYSLMEIQYEIKRYDRENKTLIGI